MINARDAISGQGTVTIDTEIENRDKNEWLVLGVSDAGCGMSPSVAALAFEPFYTTKPPGLGTGLGLPSVRGIVEAAGGQVKLESEQGVGTRISIHFPRVPAPTNATQLEDTAKELDVAAGE